MASYVAFTKLRNSFISLNPLEILTLLDIEKDATLVSCLVPTASFAPPYSELDPPSSHMLCTLVFLNGDHSHGKGTHAVDPISVDRSDYEVERLETLTLVTFRAILLVVVVIV